MLFLSKFWNILCQVMYSHGSVLREYAVVSNLEPTSFASQLTWFRKMIEAEFLCWIFRRVFLVKLSLCYGKIGVRWQLVLFASMRNSRLLEKSNCSRNYRITRLVQCTPLWKCPRNYKKKYKDDHHFGVFYFRYISVYLFRDWLRSIKIY